MRTRGRNGRFQPRQPVVLIGPAIGEQASCDSFIADIKRVLVDTAARHDLGPFTVGRIAFPFGRDAHGGIGKARLQTTQIIVEAVEIEIEASARPQFEQFDRHGESLGRDHQSCHQGSTSPDLIGLRRAVEPRVEPVVPFVQNTLQHGVKIARSGFIQSRQRSVLPGARQCMKSPGNPQFQRVCHRFAGPIQYLRASAAVSVEYLCQCIQHVCGQWRVHRAASGGLLTKGISYRFGHALLLALAASHK